MPADRPDPIVPLNTPGRRWRFRRDVVIHVAHRAGISQRILADVFDLPRSRVGAIVRRMEGLRDGFVNRSIRPVACGKSGRPAARDFGGPRRVPTSMDAP